MKDSYAKTETESRAIRNDENGLRCHFIVLVSLNGVIVVQRIFDCSQVNMYVRLTINISMFDMCTGVGVALGRTTRTDTDYDLVLLPDHNYICICVKMRKLSPVTFNKLPTCHVSLTWNARKCITQRHFSLVVFQLVCHGISYGGYFFLSFVPTMS